MHENELDTLFEQDTNHDSGHENQVIDEQLMACQLQLKEWQNKYFYLSADFENYKKRMQTDRISVAHMGQSELVRKLLPVIDGIERAFAAQPSQEMPQELQAWLEGLRMVNQSFQAFLSEVGVQEIPTQGDFNPEVHEALSQVESHEHSSGQIVAVLQKGYTFKGMVLRPALVSVAQ